MDWKFLLCLKHKFLVDKVAQPWWCMWDHKDILAHTCCTLLSQCIRSKHLSSTVSQMQGSDSGTQRWQFLGVYLFGEIYTLHKFLQKRPNSSTFKISFLDASTEQRDGDISADKLHPEIMFHFNFCMSVKHFRQRNKCSLIFRTDFKPKMQAKSRSSKFQKCSLAF